MRTYHEPMEQRVERYNDAFPDWPASHLVWSQGKASGVWMLGNDYRSTSGFYGSYPPNYLRRVRAMFTDFKPRDTIHLFAGSVHALPGETTFDLNQATRPTVVGNAHELSRHFSRGRFGLVYADPPYSPDDAKKYGTPMVQRARVMRELAKVVPIGGYVVWLDTVWPMFSKRYFQLVGTIGIVRSTNHRVRFTFIFQRGAA